MNRISVIDITDLTNKVEWDKFRWVDLIDLRDIAEWFKQVESVRCNRTERDVTVTEVSL